MNGAARHTRRHATHLVLPVERERGRRDDLVLVLRGVADAIPLVLAVPHRLGGRGRSHHPRGACLLLQFARAVLLDDVDHLKCMALP